MKETHLKTMSTSHLIFTLLIFIKFVIIVKGKWVVSERDEILDTYDSNGNFKGFIRLALGPPQDFFKQHLIKNEEQPSFWKIYSAHFGKVSTL